MSLSVFAFEDDYSYGIIQSNAHQAWFIEKCSKLKSDFRYTSDTVFDKFPWPQFDVSPSAVRRDIVVESLAKNRPSSVGATSSDYAAPDGAKSKSITAGYKDAAPDGAATQNAVVSRDAIAKIDVVPAAHELRRVLLALNQQVAAKIEKGEPVIPSGVPKDYPDASKLVTEDCIRPATP